MRDIHVAKNDLVRIWVVCKGKVPDFNQELRGPSYVSIGEKGKKVTYGEVNDKPHCPWVLHISIGKHDKTWMVKTHVATPRCLQTRNVRTCTTTWLSQQIADHGPRHPYQISTTKFGTKVYAKGFPYENFQSKDHGRKESKR